MRRCAMQVKEISMACCKERQEDTWRIYTRYNKGTGSLEGFKLRFASKPAPIT